MKLKHAYLLMTIPGALLPCALLAGYFQQVGVDVPLFLQTIFTANLASAAAAADLFISGAVFFLFVFAEGRKRGMQHLWLYIPLGIAAGISCALPLFLYNRERALDAAELPHP